MAKDKITEYDATANNNTVCGDVNIAENSALPSDMNNFAREIMSHLKEGLGSGTPLYVDQTNNRLGIGVSPSHQLHVQSSGNGKVRFEGNLNSNTSDLLISHNTSGDSGLQFNSNQLNMFTYGDITFNAGTGNISGGYPANERMRITSGGNVGIGTSSPHSIINAQGSGTTGAVLTLENSNTALSSGNTLGSIEFYSNDASTNANGVRAKINANASSASGATDIIFSNTVSADTTLSERMRIDSSGNVGIGTSSPTQKLDVVGGSANIRVAESGGGDLRMNVSGSTGAIGTHSNHPLLFRTNSTERMRIDSSGNLKVATTLSPAQLVDGTSGEGLGYKAGDFLGICRDGGGAMHLNRLTSDGEIVSFRKDATIVGNISVTGSATSYNTSSDYRLKENVTSDWDATTRLKQLNPVRFNFIADADRTVDGFLAHEVQSVVPEAITGTYNEVDADGNPVYQGIDQSKLVPLLVKTIQELEARITALETA